MDVLKRRMFQNGGAVTQPRIIQSEQKIEGFNNPRTVGVENLEEEGGVYYKRIRDLNGDITFERKIELGKVSAFDELGRTKDADTRAREALVKESQDEGIMFGAGLAAAVPVFRYGVAPAVSGIAGGLGSMFTRNPIIRRKLQEVTGGPQGSRFITEVPGKLELGPLGVAGATSLGIGGVSAGVDAVISDPEEIRQQDFEQLSDPAFIAQQIAILQSTDENVTDEQKEAARKIIDSTLKKDNTKDVDKTVIEDEDDKDAEKNQDNNQEDENLETETKPNLLGNFFNSSEFNDAIRNIGNALVREGRFGAGLAKGAADFATEQEVKGIKMAELEAQAQPKLSPKDLSTLQEFSETVTLNAQDFEGGQTAVAFMDIIIEEIEKAPPGKIGGLGGFIDSSIDKLQAFFGADIPWQDMSPQGKIEALSQVVQQGNLQAILGESGRTISDKDRAIVVEVFGAPKLFDNRNSALKKLKASRAKLANANATRKRNMKGAYNLLSDPAFGRQGLLRSIELSPVVKAILAIDPLAKPTPEKKQEIMEKVYSLRD